MSRKRKYRKAHWPWGIGLDGRQARRLRRRLGADGEGMRAWLDSTGR